MANFSVSNDGEFTHVQSATLNSNTGNINLITVGPYAILPLPADVDIGTITYDTSLNRFQGRTNTGWLPFTSGAGGGTVTSIDQGTGMSFAPPGGPITTSGTINLADTTVAAGAYTSADITVDAQGRLTAASNGNSGEVAPGIIPQLAYFSGITTVSSAGFGFNRSATLGTNALGIGLGSAAAGTDSIALGNSAVARADDSIAIGPGAEALAAGSIAIGQGCKITNAIASNSVVIGNNSANTNVAGNDNICIGTGAGAIFAGGGLAGEENVLIGRDAGGITTTGAGNTCIGAHSGSATVGGSNNVFLGSGAGASVHDISAGDDDKLVIANGLAAGDALIFGDFSSNQVGINTGLLAMTSNLDIAASGNSTQPGINLKRVDNSIGPGDNIGTISFTGTAGIDTLNPNLGARISSQTAEMWSPGVPGVGAAGANLSFSTTISGTFGADFNEKMRITDDGTVGIFHNTTAAFSPTAPNILQVRATGSDGAIFMEVQRPNSQAILKLANIPILAGTTGPSGVDVGYVKFQASDAGDHKDICKVTGELTSNTATEFTGALKFSTMDVGVENERMHLSAGGDGVSLNTKAQLALATGGNFTSPTLCGLGGGNEANCGLSFNNSATIQMGVDNGSGMAALRMQMSSVPSNAVIFSANAGGSAKSALIVTSDIATGTANTTHGIKVPFTGASTMGGISRASVNNRSNWQDGHLGNCERVYFTATDFHVAGPPAFAGARYDVVPGQPTYAYGELNWIATKLLPVGFKIDAGALLVIMGFWLPAGACIGPQLANLELYATSIVQDGQVNPSPCSAPQPAIATTIALAIPFPFQLNMAASTAGPSPTSGIGKAFGSAGGPTVMITIKVALVGPAAPGVGEGITGAFIDITRG